MYSFYFIYIYDTTDQKYFVTVDNPYNYLHAFMWT